MKKGRLEAFSDGVLAIIITIMVLELKVPHSADIKVLLPLLPVFLSYLLSFIYVGIYWNNHHHMLYLVENINGKVLWANLNLLLWLSLIPFVTAWMGENHFAKWPVMCYGIVLFMNAVSYTLLAYLLVKSAGPHSALAHAFGRDWKGKLSNFAYAISIPLAYFMPLLSLALYVLIAMVWFIPDKRVEKQVLNHPED